ncbi:hypothetical protein NMY22_g296 [Coprinellus aureogranulatus]|nr:hypothetical protein NMY22_g296 [Coprinellus aureogranulatus]
MASSDNYQQPFPRIVKAFFDETVSLIKTSACEPCLVRCRDSEPQAQQKVVSAPTMRIGNREQADPFCVSRLSCVTEWVPPHGYEALDTWRLLFLSEAFVDASGRRLRRVTQEKTDFSLHSCTYLHRTAEGAGFREENNGMERPAQESLWYLYWIHTQTLSMSTMTSSNSIVETLKEDVLNTVTPNLCHGTIPLDPKFGTLFYKTEQSSEAKYIDFAKGTLKDEDIQMLAKASEKATFGRNKEDVLDETYRKAWKMDTTQFATQFDVVRSGILDIVHDQLLHYENNTKKLEADLYKLNVYGPGSFFKPHVDTPRSDKLFATLVIVLPTIHKGGNLLLGEEGNLLNFDSASKVYYPKSKEPRIAFVSFYSDIPHEVLPVESGYRVTLTYNLYLKEFWQGPLTLKSSSTDTYSSLLASFAKALASPTVLPKGGALGFGLLYRYPIDPDTTNLAAFTGALKGNDALIRAVCKALGLEPSVQVLYSRGYRNSDKFLTNSVVDGDHFCELAEPYDQPPRRKLWRDAGGMLVLRAENPAPSSFKVPVLWVTEPSEMLTTHLAYATYGNEASLECVYGDLVLVAKVPPYRERVEHLKTMLAGVLPEKTLKDMDKALKDFGEEKSPVIGVKRKRPDEDSQDLGETDEEE